VIQRCGRAPIPGASNSATEPGRHILLRIGQVSRRPHAAGAWQLVLAGRSRPHSSRHPINAQCRRCGRLCYLSPKSENDLRKLGSFCQDRGNIHILFCIIDAASLAFRGAGLKRREGFGWPPRLKARVRSCAEVQPLVPVPTPTAVDLSCMTCKKEWGGSNWHVGEIRVRVIN
jgi:hypothetical protein